MNNKNKLNSKKILLVDDSLLTATIISEFLSENGYEIENVITGEDAVQKAYNTHIDLILMDIELAGEMNGIDAAYRIINNSAIPIIFLTANTSKKLINEIKEVKAYGYLLKGMDKGALLSSIEMTLNLHDAYKELENRKKQYFQLAEDAPIGIIKCDKNGNIVYANKKAVKIFDSPSGEVTEKINLLQFHPFVKYGLSQKFNKCLQNKESDIFEMNYKSVCGKKVYLRLHIKLLTNRNKVEGGQIIIDDISEKKYLEDELHRLSIIDYLTNTYNRRFFIQKSKEEIELVERKKIPTFSIVMLDIDHFKRINDRFGHDSGDLVLKGITQTIKNMIHKTDCLARWGGEEFVILLHGTAIDNAMILVERLRKSISEMKLQGIDRVTASFGVVEYSSGDTVDLLIHKADNLMYKAKAAGRNCVYRED